jgi:hypothetical protein
MTKTYLRHGATPTHTYDEWGFLVNLGLATQYVAYIPDRTPVAGVGYIPLNNQAVSAFYFVSDEKYKKTQALSLCIKRLIDSESYGGGRTITFGTSSNDEVAVPGIVKFKEGFGAVGVFRDTLRWERP